MVSWLFSFIILETVLLFLLIVVGVFFFFYWRKQRDLFSFAHEYLSLTNYGLVVFHEDGRVFHFNKKASEYLPVLIERRSGKETLNSCLHYVFDHAVDVDESLKKTLSMISKLKSHDNFREVIKDRSGRLCLIEIDKDSHNQTLMIMSDISALKNNEDMYFQLLDYTSDLQRSIEASGNGVFVCRQSSYSYSIVYVNEAVCRFVGLTKQDLMGGDIEDLVSHIQDIDAQDQLMNAIESRVGCNIEVCASRSGKKKKWFHVQLSHIYDRPDKTSLITGIITDVTETKLREQGLSQSKKVEALAQMAAGVAHDFNNIFSIIDGHTHFAEKMAAGNDNLRDHLDKIRVASERGADLTKKMLAFGRKGPTAETATDLNLFLDFHTDYFKSLMNGKADLDIEFSKDICPVPLSEDALESVLENLLLNARDAMEEGGVCSIQSAICEAHDVPADINIESLAERYALLEVRDTGIGIKPEHMQSIFDPFYTNKKTGKGTGLGLSVVYGVINDVGGAVHVESEYGSGTVFHLYLPIVKDAKVKKITGNKDDIQAMTYEGYTALVVDDEEELREMVSKMLEDFKMDILCAENGEEALVMQDEYEGKIDLLLTDIVMPHLDGLTLAELVQAERPDINIIFMSGYPKNEEDHSEIIQSSGFLSKPFKLPDLAAVLFENFRNEKLQEKEMKNGSS